ncbi:DUF1798 family protein [Lentibacillus sp. L22]|uniref:DUF1798 family protein n=1 Tax=Lentibacillus sp. L22 TaxID=3163028 RepID=UPI0034656C62
MTDLKQQTELLKEHLDQLKKRYEKSQPPEDKRDKAFFLFVKETTEPIYRMLATWEQTALQAVKNRTLNIHPHQITSTRENMELLLMHSFFVDVKRKRYMELNKSVHYIFDQVLRDL